MDAFDTCLAITLQFEGGYTNDPTDPGNWTGAAVASGVLRGTKYGISAAVYPHIDIANLTKTQAASIYRAAYWAPIAGEKLPLALAAVVFDGAVNSGVSQSAMWLQAAVHVEQDGYIGPITLAAVASGWNAPIAPDAIRPDQALLAAVLASRMEFLARNTSFVTFGNGWSKRVMQLSLQAAALLGK